MIVSRETQQLELYTTMIRKWNSIINLVSAASLDEIESRHLADSRQLVDLSLATSGSWLDLGSGGGLPGLVVAILRPDLKVSLVESDKRKSTFLRSVRRDLSLTNLSVHDERIELLSPQLARNISARALAPLSLLLSYVERHLDPQGTAWLMKGRSWRTEVEEAKKSWYFNLVTHKSSTDPDAAILEITGISHA